MTRLRVSLRVPVGLPLPDIAAFVARCEKAGFEGIVSTRHCSLMAGMEIKSCVKAPSRLPLIGIMVLSAIGICRRMMVSETPAS
jgi:hypothetical protein